MTMVLQKALHLMHVKLLNLVATDCDPLLMAIMRKLDCVCVLRHTILPPVKAWTGHGTGCDTAVLSMAIGEVCGITMTKGQGTLARVSHRK